MPEHQAKTIGERLRHELREYAILVAYLYAIFLALFLFKAAILDDAGIAFLPLGLAAAKALILGKFILLGQAIGIGKAQGGGGVARSILRQAFLLTILLFLLTILEEALVALVHGAAIGSSLSSHLAAMFPEMLAMCLLMLLALIPYLAYRETNKVLGNDMLNEVLFGRPNDRRSDS